MPPLSNVWKRDFETIINYFTRKLFQNLKYIPTDLIQLIYSFYLILFSFDDKFYFKKKTILNNKTMEIHTLDKTINLHPIRLKYPLLNEKTTKLKFTFITILKKVALRGLQHAFKIFLK